MLVPLVFMCWSRPPPGEQALDVATEGGPRYAFLVHNASVHAWNVLRIALMAGRAGNHAEELLR